MHSLTPATDRRSVALPLLCLLFTLLLVGGFRTCDPALGSSKLPTGSGGQIEPAIPVMALAKSPEAVRNLIRHLRSVRHWNPLPGFKGSRVFDNVDRLLPRGSYREYDILPYVQGINRGRERVVVDALKRNFYYTNDHYETFYHIQLP